MTRVRLIAALDQKFEGRRLLSGEPFDAGEKDAADLVAMRFAKRAPASNKALAAENHEAKEPRVKRAYKRRDMTAEKA